MKVTEEGSAPPPWTKNVQQYLYTPANPTRPMWVPEEVLEANPSMDEKVLPVVTYTSSDLKKERVVGWGGEVVREIVTEEGGIPSPVFYIGGIRIIGAPTTPSTVEVPRSLLELIGREVDKQIRAAFEEGFAAASVPVLAEGQL
jgi:hypothetical protein